MCQSSPSMLQLSPGFAAPTFLAGAAQGFGERPAPPPPGCSCGLRGADDVIEARELSRGHALRRTLAPAAGFVIAIKAAA